MWELQVSSPLALSVLHTGHYPLLTTQRSPHTAQCLLHTARHTARHAMRGTQCMPLSACEYPGGGLRRRSGTRDRRPTAEGQYSPMGSPDHVLALSVISSSRIHWLYAPCWSPQWMSVRLLERTSRSLPSIKDALWLCRLSYPSLTLSGIV